MRTLPRAAQLYLWGIWGAAAIAVPLAIWSSPLRLDSVPLILIGIALFVVADFFEVHFANRDGNTIIMTLADAPSIFFLAILGTPGVFVILFGSLFADLLHRRAWYRGLFNATERSLTYLLLVFVAWLLNPSGEFIFQGPRGAVTLLAVAATLFVVNTVFVSTIVAFATERPLFDTYADSFRMVHWVHFITMPFGAILSILWRVNPWMFLAALLPLIMSQRAIRAVAGWQAESQRNQELAQQAQNVSQRLERLQGATTAMMTVSTSQAILQTVSTQLATLLEATASWVVFDQRTGLHVTSLQNVPSSVKFHGNGFRPIFDQNAVQQVFRPQLLEFAPTAPDSWHSLILIPLVHGEHVHGIACLATEHATALEASERRVLMAFAAQAALMIEHIGLFEELQQKQNELVRSSKLAALGTFAAGIAHEFNNLLAGVLGYAELAEISTDEAERDYALNVIKQSSVRGRSITRSLLTFARRDAAAREPHDLTAIIEDTLVLIERELAKRNIVVERQFFPIPQTMCDAGQISQVILNLLTNARDAMSEQDGGKITIVVFDDGRNITMTIKDSGSGIPESLLDQVFQPFTTTKGALGGSKVAGTGLGLSICYGIVEEHEGTIGITSELGHGTTVTVTLPIVQTHMEQHVERTDDLLSPLSILLLDDDVDVAASLARMLIGRGHAVSVANSGTKALALIESNAFDVICCDAIMPEMNGLVFMQHLRSRDITTPVLVMTGEPSSLLVDQMRGFYPVSVLQKPFTIDELLATLAHLPSFQRTAVETVHNA